MPTSSQSRILSMVDYHLFQQQANGHTEATKGSGRISLRKKSAVESKRRQSKDNNRRSSARKKDETTQSFSSTQIPVRRRSSGTLISHRSDLLHMPVINLYSMVNNEQRTYVPDSFNNTHRIASPADKHSSSIIVDENDTSNHSLPTDSDPINRERRASLLTNNTRRLLQLGTIRPSKTFYQDLPEVDVEQLMKYFRRMKTTNQKITSEKMNQEFQTQFIEYKPKIFFDSTCVTKTQVKDIEKLIEPYADQIRTHQAELIKLDNPIRFIIKQTNNDTPLTTIPREYNDCLLTLLARTDSLRQSNLITELAQDQLLEDIKDNSLDISYFPGGMNYEIPHEEIENTGQMSIETYQKLKKRLNNRRVWYFNGPPAKKPSALLAILPLDSSLNINHQHLLDCLYDRLKTFSMNDNFDVTQRIVSLEFIPLNCILNSHEMSNQFMIDCDTKETKQQLMEKPLKLNVNKQTMIIVLRSYDEDIQREYEKFIKAEKYRELIRNHHEAIKRTPSKK